MRQIEVLRGDISALKHVVETTVNKPEHHDENDAAAAATFESLPHENVDPVDASQVTIDDEMDDVAMDALNSIVQTNQC